MLPRAPSSSSQLTWLVTRICQRVKDQRSVMIVMLGDSDLTMYGTTECHGLLRHLVKSVSLVLTSCHICESGLNILSSLYESNFNIFSDP